MTLPTPELFITLIACLLLVLLTPLRPRMPHSVFTVAQGVLGVTIGTYLHTDTLGGLGWDWVPIVLVSLATLGLTTFAGVALARVTGTDSVTSSLGTVAGGASGIVAMAQDLGANDRLVAFMQYIRLLIVLLVTPVAVGLFFGGADSGSVPDDGVGLLTPWSGWLLIAVAVAVGIPGGRLVRLPAPALLGPLLVTAALTLTGVAGDAQPPSLARGVAFGVIGAQIGLRFTPEDVRAAGRMVPAVALSTLLLIVACYGLGLLLVLTTGVSKLDAYLAATPGGLYAVLPIAFGSGANTTFVLAVQTLRVFVAVLLAPMVTRWLHRERLRELAERELAAEAVAESTV